MKRGLTLGKFAPFHKGHQHVVETALSEVNELVVLIYDTELTNVPLQVRADWIRRLYPGVRVIEGWNGPEGYGDTPEIRAVQENYILECLQGLEITHFFCSEFYGDHVSKALGAVDRRVDEARSTIPISGTELRADPYAGRKYLAPEVYADLITRVCFMGSPSTGKSTLARTLAERHRTRWMPEYGAEFWLKNQVDRRITLEQFEEIAPEHVRREDRLAMDSRTYLFCDTCPITTFVFAKDYHGKAGPVLTQYAREAERRFDLFFVCDTDIPYADTWDRSGEAKRHWFQRQILADLAERRIPFFTLRGSLEQRVSTVNAVLERFSKYTNVLDVFDHSALFLGRGLE
jgi:NadR type nicotinamide-nucleotide adenylyltransferase